MAQNPARDPLVPNLVMDRLTNRSFWKLIGQLLKQHRLNRDWNLIDVQHHGGPNYATVELHEAGHIRTTTKLERHLRVFDLDLTTAFRLVLDGVSVEHIKGETAVLLGKYVRTTDDGKYALRKVAAALPYAAAVMEAPSESPGSPPDLQGFSRRTPSRPTTDPRSA